MKSIFPLLFVSLISFSTVFAQTKLSGSYEINGDVSPIKNGYKAYLTHPVTDDFKYQRDSAIITDGHFTFKGVLKEPELVYISISGSKSKGEKPTTVTGYYIFLEPSVITLTAPSPNLKNPIITGSLLTADYCKFTQLGDSARKPLDAASRLFYKVDTADHKERDRLASVVEQRQAEFRDRAYKSFILSHPDSYISVYALTFYAIGEIKTDEFENVFNTLNKRFANTPTIIKLKKRLENAKASETGKIARDFSAPDTAGNLIKLSSFRGKYVLLDFWASWCGPCRKESPFLVKAYQDYKDKNFAILSVSDDQQKSGWIKAIKQDHLEWQHVSDLKLRNEALDLYNISAIPQNFLIDPQGKIIAKNLYGNELEKKLHEVLDK